MVNAAKFRRSFRAAPYASEAKRTMSVLENLPSLIDRPVRTGAAPRMPSPSLNCCSSRRSHRAIGSFVAGSLLMNAANASAF